MNPKLFTPEQVKELMSALSNEKMQTLVTKSREEYKKDPERFGSFKILITSQDEDRVGDKVNEDGWDMKHYLNNPVVLWGHDYSKMPVGITLSLEKTDQGWVAEGMFAPEEANPMGQQLRRLYDLGLLNAASVGFIPKRYDEKDRSIILEQELLEWSFVSVPANPYALNLLKSQNLNADELITKGFLTKSDDVEEKDDQELDISAENNKDDAESNNKDNDDESANNNENRGIDDISIKNIENAKKNIGNALSKLNTEVGNLITRTFETITSELSLVHSNEQDNNKCLNEFKVKTAIERLEKLLAEGLDIKGVLDQALTADAKNATSTPCESKSLDEKEMTKLIKLLNTVTAKALEKHKSKN